MWQLASYLCQSSFFFSIDRTRRLKAVLLSCSLTLKLEKAQRMLAAICSRARNAYSRKQLKADFAEGIQELHEQAGSSGRS